jgi:uncharacterized Zn finger protein
VAWSRNEYPYARTIAVKGGIKARSQRGAFASQWWARRWLSVLEALNLGGRLSAARTYARKGQVVDLDIQPGVVTARVQGSAPTPYRVSIELEPLDDHQQQRLAEELAEETYCLAKLLAREMPHDIETIFEFAGVTLFPARARDLETECSCPDWSNPCKHIAAVYYLLGEEFDRDPFLIFRLRGIDLDALIEGSTAAGAQEISTDAAPLVSSELTSLDAEHFWDGPRAELDFSIDETQRPAPLLRLLGNLPFWRGDQPLFESLEPAYARAAAEAVALLSR